MQLVRAAKDVHVGHLLEQAVSVAFGHAADDGDDLRFLADAGPLERTETGVDFVLGVLPDRTCVQDDQIGRRHVFREPIAARRQFTERQLAVECVHLAAHRFEIDRPRVGHGLACRFESFSRRFVACLRRSPRAVLWSAHSEYSSTALAERPSRS